MDGISQEEWTRDYKAVERLRNKIGRKGGEPTSDREKEIYRKYKGYLPLYGKEYEEFKSRSEAELELSRKMASEGKPYQTRDYSMPVVDCRGTVVGYTLPSVIDEEIREYVVDLNMKGISTEESCSGHGQGRGWIILGSFPDRDTLAEIKRVGRDRGLRNIRSGKSKPSKMGNLGGSGYPQITFDVPSSKIK